MPGPLFRFVQTREIEVQTSASGPVEKAHLVQYAPKKPHTFDGEAFNHQEPLFGILNAKKEAWLLEPSSVRFRDLTPRLKLVRPLGRNYCILDMTTGTCRDTGMQYSIYSRATTVGSGHYVSPKMPGWASPLLLANCDGTKGSVDVFSKDYSRLGTVHDLPCGVDLKGVVWPDIFVIRLVVSIADDFLVFRGTEGHRLIRHRDGRLEETELANIEVHTMRSDTQEKLDMPHFFWRTGTSDLLWPLLFDDDGQVVAPPDGLLGMTMLFKWPGKGWRPTWLATWLTPEGTFQALVNTKRSIPTMKELAASRHDANIVSHELVDVTREGYFGGQKMTIMAYILGRKDGSAFLVARELKKRKEFRKPEGFTVLVTNLPSVSAARQFVTKHNQDMKVYLAKSAIQQKKFNEQMKAQREASARFWREYNAQRARARSAAKAARNARAASSWQRYQARERQIAAVKAARQATVQSSKTWFVPTSKRSYQKPRQRFSMDDLWKSYDKSNTTGNYKRSSGATTNCRLGSGC